MYNFLTIPNQYWLLMGLDRLLLTVSNRSEVSSRAALKKRRSNACITGEPKLVHWTLIVVEMKPRLDPPATQRRSQTSNVARCTQDFEGLRCSSVQERSFTDL